MLKCCNKIAVLNRITLRLALQAEAGSGPKYVGVAALIAVALGGSAVVVYAL